MCTTAALLLAGLHLGAACSRQPDSSRATANEVATGDQVPAQPLALLAVTEGLAPAHLGTPPLLEKVAYVPASEHGKPGHNVVTRIYPDGAYYMLISESKGAPVPERWNHPLSLKADGIKRLEALFARICRAADSRLVDDVGTVKYLVTSKACTRTFVNGLPSNLSPVAEADTIINESPRPIPPSP
jgi:hypothetical protein